MMRKVVVEIPEETFPILRQDEAGLARELRLAAAIKWHEMGLLSQGRAAEVAGMSRAEFLGAMGRFGASPFQYSPEELEGEINVE